MSVEISMARIAALSLRPQLFSGNQDAVLGGPSLPIPRPGDRFAAELTTTQLLQDAESRELMADLFEASTLGARVAINQPNFDRTAGYGPVVVDGGGQSGTTIAVRSGSVAASVLRGQFFSVFHGGKHYLYMVTVDCTFGPDGRLAIPIWPMLRALTIDGSAVALDAPMIEGQLVGFDSGINWSRNMTDPFTFSIVERA